MNRQHPLVYLRDRFSSERSKRQGTRAQASSRETTRQVVCSLLSVQISKFWLLQSLVSSLRTDTLSRAQRGKFFIYYCFSFVFNCFLNKHCRAQRRKLFSLSLGQNGFSSNSNIVSNFFDFIPNFFKLFQICFLIFDHVRCEISRNLRIYIRDVGLFHKSCLNSVEFSSN